MSSPGKYLPSLEGLNLEFHRRAVETGRLHLQRCADCGVFCHPPRYYCLACSSPDRELVPSSERGSVHSFTVSHRTFDPGWAEETPYATVVVELDEGPRVIGALRGLDPSALELGRRVRVEVERRGEEFAFLWVEPDSAEAG
ncbi:MAG: OB-fold domain-containing protein [Actinomycetota bacterium]